MMMRRGTVKSFDTESFTAAVQVDGSVPAWLTGARVSRAIPAAEMITGRGCLIAFVADTMSPDEAVILAVYT